MHSHLNFMDLKCCCPWALPYETPPPPHLPSCCCLHYPLWVAGEVRATCTSSSTTKLSRSRQGWMTANWCMSASPIRPWPICPIWLPSMKPAGLQSSHALLPFCQHHTTVVVETPAKCSVTAQQICKTDCTLCSGAGHWQKLTPRPADCFHSLAIKGKLVSSSSETDCAG